MENQNSSLSNWEKDVFATLKRLVKQSGKSIDLIFSQIDTDGSGTISDKEFHRAMKMLSL
jgi:Ca2+-binding EF-hand superfamily protein